MIVPTVKNLLDIHKDIREMYPKSISKGHVNHGKIQLIMDRPFREIYGYKKYDTIYEQAACLMEGIIRLHPFPDGNKRTALAMTYLFMLNNDVYMVVPIDIVRFMVEVANEDASTEECIDVLICRIARWLEERSAVNLTELDAKTSKYVNKPLRKVKLLVLTGVGIIFAARMLRKWLALDMHPEYAKGGYGILGLVLSLASYSKETAREHPVYKFFNRS